MAIQRCICFNFPTFKRTRKTVTIHFLALYYTDISIYSIRYTLASKMEDIHMGDTHLIALNDCGIDDDEPSCDQYVALIVAQHRNKFDFTALDSGISHFTI